MCELIKKSGIELRRL